MQINKHILATQPESRNKKEYAFTKLSISTNDCKYHYQKEINGYRMNEVVTTL
jgi:hypothetical protein